MGDNKIVRRLSHHRHILPRCMDGFPGPGPVIRAGPCRGEDIPFVGARHTPLAVPPFASDALQKTYQHGPIGRRTCGYILVTDQSDAGHADISS
eukprot:1187788-Prorocentrum_minimum.AAC.1